MDWERMYPTLEVPRLVHSNHAGQFTTAYSNSSPRGSKASGFLKHPLTHVQTPANTLP